MYSVYYVHTSNTVYLNLLIIRFLNEMNIFYLTMHSYSPTSLNREKFFLEMFRTGMMLYANLSEETKDGEWRVRIWISLIYHNINVSNGNVKEKPKPTNKVKSCFLCVKKMFFSLYRLCFWCWESGNAALSFVMLIKVLSKYPTA